jgi:hypothetical protein
MCSRLAAPCWSVLVMNGAGGRLVVRFVDLADLEPRAVARVAAEAGYVPGRALGLGVSVVSSL